MPTQPRGTPSLPQKSAESSSGPSTPHRRYRPLESGTGCSETEDILLNTLGGVFGWLIGLFGWDLVKDFFFNYVPGFTPELFDLVSEKYKQNALLAVFGAALTPIPYKIFTIAAGVCGVPLFELILGSILGRGGRFFLVSLIILLVGDKAKPFIDKYFNLLVSIFFILLVGGFVLIKYAL